MRIVIDHVINWDGTKVGEVVIHTERVDFTHHQHPTDPTQKIHAVDYVAGLHKGTFSIAGTGWDELTKHPAHAGKTRLQVLLDELAASGDVDGKTAFGL